MSLEHIASIIWKRGLLFMAALLLFSGAVVAVTLSLPKSYETTATLVVSGLQGEEPLALDTNVGEQLTRTFATLSGNPNVAEAVAARLPFPLTRNEVLNQTSFAPVERTQLLQITAEGDAPGSARLLANTYANVFVERIQRRFTSGNAPARLSISEYASSPDTAARPNPPLYIGLGTILAAFLALGVVLLRDRLDTSVRIGDTDTTAFGQPIVARIPLLSGKRPTLTPRVVDAFRLLRANLNLSSTERLEVVAVTSGSAAEGKSTICANLAVTAAADGESVVLIEADLRNPGLRGTALGKDFVPTGHGLSRYLTGADDEESIVSALPSVPGLDVIWSGPVPPNPALLLGSDRMVDLVRRLRQDYDRVIIDTSPISVGADATLAITHVDGCLFVIDQGANQAMTLAGLQQLQKLRTRMLGVILNRAKLPKSQEYGYYGTGLPAEVVEEPAPGRFRRASRKP